MSQAPAVERVERFHLEFGLCLVEGKDGAGLLAQRLHRDLSASIRLMTLLSGLLYIGLQDKL